MRSAHRVEERVRIDGGGLLRPCEILLVDRAERLRRREASACLHIQTADWVEDESGVVIGKTSRHHHFGSEYVIVSDFPQAMQGEIRVSVVLMPSRRHRVEQDARRGGTPAVLDLETVEIQEAEHVLP